MSGPDVGSQARRFTAACVQMRAGRDPAANREAVVAAVRAAASRGAHYIQTPEMTALVERDRDRLFAHAQEQDRDATLAALREVARETRTIVHIGSLALRDGDRIANRALIVNADGAVVAAYDKLHLYDVDLPNGESWRESATYTGGDQAIVVALPWTTLGVSICYDLRFPALYRALAEAGAELLSAPACFTRQTGEAHWHVLQRARAIETGCFMISAAQGGTHEDGRQTFGHSLIVDPWGHVLAEAASDEPGLVLAEIDLTRVDEARRRIPVLSHARPFDVQRVGCSPIATP